MKTLEQLGLYGNGLIVVDSPEMTARYNACLKDMSLSETNLDQFRIDAMGWSPEIAEEKGDNDYLSHGVANPLAIILTPKQRHSPIYNPFHSFDWDLMKQLYDTHVVQVDLTTRHEGICVDIDQDVDRYLDPNDLLLVDEVVVRLWTPSRLMKKAHRQKVLVKQFMHDQKSHHDTELINQILSSTKDVGDMRTKPMCIQDMEYTDVFSFYTRALGGWFVLRSPTSDETLLLSKNAATKARGVTSCTDKQTLADLERLGLISFGVERWIKHLHRLEILRDSFLMDILSELYPDMDYVNMTSPERKQIRQKKEVQRILPEVYHLLDKLIRELRRGKVSDRISKKIRPYLAHPLPNLPASISEVVWFILALVCDGRAVVRLYRYDKDAFFEAYEKWKTPRKTWAIQCIKNYYEHRMMRE